MTRRKWNSKTRLRKGLKIGMITFIPIESMLTPKEPELNCYLKHLETITNRDYNPYADLRGTLDGLSRSFRKQGPLLVIPYLSPKEEDKIVETWYKGRLEEIDNAKKGLLQRLDAAKESGALKQTDYLEIVIDLTSRTGPFGRARKEAQDIYEQRK